MTQPLTIEMQRTELQRELWYRGRIDWKLRPEQKLFKREIEANNVKLFVGNISRRWGKSFSLVLFAIEQCLRNPGLKIRYGAAFQNDLTEFILPAFAIILEDCPEDIRPHYQITGKTWRFKNGSEIKLVGLDKNPNGLRGNAISIIIIDEAGFVSKLQYLYTSVIIPATAKQKNIRLIFISTPPESPDHFFTTLIDKAQSDGYYATFTIDDISDMPPEERKRLLEEVGGEDSVTAKREFFCQIIVDEERCICPTFDKAKHVAEVEAPKYAYYTIGGDIGGIRDKSVLHLVTFDHATRKVLFLDERSWDCKTPTPVIVKEAMELEAGLDQKQIAKWIDAHGQTRTDLVYFGYVPTEPPLPDKDTFSASLNFLRSAFYNDEIRIHPRCKLLIRTLETALLNEQKTDFVRSKLTGHADAAMSAIYALRHVDRVTNPVPPPSHYTHFIAPKPKINHPLAGLTRT